ncbi:helix-turn-helix transcriptional regulator [Streptomyces sp. F63]|uniref:helix-turn-helix domain-containing protein n=1 Tax=Streptomyces sp. F63 TaxID=2824887 RepID=UPI001B373E15|nr:helix-turn-helix transcriptional regulator [Streptomyces sp. F63]MBQ0984891.1 helix-turn-helix transcriptional regulator [Streptomyces sp. F63]
MRTVKRHRKNASALRLVGRQLACFREAAGLTQRELAARLNLAEETVASVEQGRRPLKPDLAQRFDEYLDTKGALSVAVDNMPEVDRIPAWAEEFVDLEREAIALSSYQNQVLPGQLQTERYARAVFRSRVPSYSEQQIEDQVSARMARRQSLHREPAPTLSFVIWEPVLLDRLGGEDVYAEQLRCLRDASDSPDVSLQIMPLGRTGHAGLNGPFVLLETPEHQHVAYTETQRGSQLITDLDEVSILNRKYAMLRSQALNPDESTGLLDRLLGER